MIKRIFLVSIVVFSLFLFYDTYKKQKLNNNLLYSNIDYITSDEFIEKIDDLKEIVEQTNFDNYNDDIKNIANDIAFLTQDLYFDVTINDDIKHLIKEHLSLLLELESKVGSLDSNEIFEDYNKLCDLFIQKYNDLSKNSN